MPPIKVKKEVVIAPYYNLGDHFLRFDEAQSLSSGEKAQAVANLGGVSAPSSTTDNAIARFDGTSGQIQNSGVIVSDNNALSLPVSALGAGSLLFGTQPNGVTALGIHTGTENILRVYMQDVKTAHFSNGAMSSVYNTFGAVVIADDDYYEIDPEGWTNNPVIGSFNIDRSGVAIVSCPENTDRAVIFQYRIATPEANELVEVATNFTIGTSTVSTTPTPTNYTDGQITILVSANADKMWIVNRAGASVTFTGTFFGHGGGMNK